MWQKCRYGSSFTIASLFCLESFLGPSMPFLVKSELATSLKMPKISFDPLKNISWKNASERLAQLTPVVQVQNRSQYCYPRNGILLPKLFWPTVRKTFEITRTTYSNSERSEQFLKQNTFLTCYRRFLLIKHIVTIKVQILIRR